MTAVKTDFVSISALLDRVRPPAVFTLLSTVMARDIGEAVECGVRQTTTCTTATSGRGLSTTLLLD